MAPVSVTSVGVARQTIDDPELSALIDRLSSFGPPEPGGTASPSGGAAAAAVSAAAAADAVDVVGLTSELEMWPRWRFQEQADLYEWIKPLDAMDAALARLVEDHPALLLVGPAGAPASPGEPGGGPPQAESAADAASVPGSAVRRVRAILRFLSHLLRNASNKSVFNSVDRLSDLLAASDDEAADLALEALANLAAPPTLHRQTAPEGQQHSTALHAAGPSPPYDGGNGGGAGPRAGPGRAGGCDAHARLLSLARGWGSRGSGLGLARCVESDDSRGGRAGLPGGAGALSFECFRGAAAAVSAAPPSPAGKARAGADPTSGAGGGGGGGTTTPSRLVRVSLAPDEILQSPLRAQPEKRRRVDAAGDGGAVGGAGGGGGGGPAAGPGDQPRARPTPELFFLALERAGGRGSVPPSRLFPLLAEVRLARSFHTRPDRVRAVERRLRAVSAVLHAHPGKEAVRGYLAAQPELASELCDLIRPTVSGGAVSSPIRAAAADGAAAAPAPGGGGRDAISAVADPPPPVPYATRSLAVEALTALVARRDPGGGMGESSANRQAATLAELGVGKGQFLGLLPALVRYSLASLGAFFPVRGGQAGAAAAAAPPSSSSGPSPMDPDDALGLSLGLTFVQSSRPPPPPRHEEEERALEFVDLVLTLTSAVVSVPSGAAALTECGLVPALVSAVGMDPEGACVTDEVGGGAAPGKGGREPYADTLLKFVAAQAVQILEGAIVSHANALAAFRDLGGVDLLVRRLGEEIEKVKVEGGEAHKSANRAAGRGEDEVDQDGDVAMADAGDRKPAAAAAPAPSGGRRPLRAARRVLLFSLVNCLTVVFHQQETASSGTASGGSAAAAQSGGASQLRKPELTNSIMDILNHVGDYGGVLAAMCATLLSDVMNADPQVVRHVHQSGLAESFLRVFVAPPGPGRNDEDAADGWIEPVMPPSSELVMALPNVISALALTEDGASAIREADPFPSLLAVFCTPRYAMPESRCLLNEMAAIVGTGMDEVMRHVPSLRPLVLRAVVQALRRVVYLGRKLVEQEQAEEDMPAAPSELETHRTRLAQYACNLSQILEQVLHQHEEHATPFVEAGGLDALLDLQPVLIPAGRRFLVHVSCLSCPSLAGLTHSNTTSALTSAIKHVAASYDAQKLIRKLMDRLKTGLDEVGVAQRELRHAAGLSPPDPLSGPEGSDEFRLANGILEGIPCVPLHVVPDGEDKALAPLSEYLRTIAFVEFLSLALSLVVRSSVQRSHEMGSGWGRSEREWKKELASPRFSTLVGRLSELQRQTLLESCRVRTQPGYEERESVRRCPPDGENPHHPATYSLRIVCAEGAVVRDGVEIDACASVGGLEMGECVAATERVVNTSGVLRYRTQRGWVSEQTRGPGREAIAEVVSFGGVAEASLDVGESGKEGRIECGIPDLRSASASILARLQGSHRGLFTCLSRAVALGVRNLPLRTLSFQQGTVGAHVGAVVQTLRCNLELGLRAALDQEGVRAGLGPAEGKSDWSGKNTGVTDEALTMYLGSMLNLLHSCLYEEKRERHIFNVLLLVGLMRSDGFTEGLFAPEEEGNEKTASVGSGKEVDRAALPSGGLFGAVRFVLKQSLADMDKNATSPQVDSTLVQRVSRHISASLPPAISLLRRLMSKSLLAESQVSSVLSKMKGSDLESLLDPEKNVHGAEDNNEMAVDSKKKEMKFHPGKFGRLLHCCVSDVASELWNDSRLMKAPAHVVHPVLQLVGDVLTGLEAAAKPIPNSAERGSSGTSLAGSGSSGGGGPQGDLFRAMNAFLGGAARTRLRDMEGGDGDAPAPPPPPPPPFEPSEETVARLAEMGFGRDHALEALESMESNRLEVAMEYCLSHPPPSPQTVERRRAMREERQRQREERERQERERREQQQQREQESASDTAPGPAASPPSPSASAPGNADSSSARVLPQDTESGASRSSGGPAASSGVGSIATAVSAPVAAATSGAEGDMDEKEGSDAVDTEAANENGNDKKANKPPEERTVTRAAQHLCMWKGQVKKVSLDLIEGGSRIGACGQGISFSHAYGEAETLTVVISFFLLDICERYPEMRAGMVMDALARLKSHLRIDKHSSVKDGQEQEIASVSHACTILLRALPRTRSLVLREGLVGCLVQCFRFWFSSSAAKGEATLPVWLAPQLLLLDVMAQPTTVLPEENVLSSEGMEDEVGDTDKKPSKEYVRVCAEHKRQAALLSKTASQIFAAVNSKSLSKKKKGKEKDCKSKGDSNGAEGQTASSLDASSVFASIPTYQPLLSPDMAECCLLLSLQLMRVCSKSAGKFSDGPRRIGMVRTLHASLLLLARVLRSHKLALQCLRQGGAELLLSLPADCRFPGNAGLAAVILRRTLEDEPTLQTAMEAEIRAAVARLHKRQSRGSSSHERPSASSRSFVQAVTPLICRDPLVFVKAAATSVRVETPTSEAAAGSRQSARIVLLSSEERARNIKALADLIGGKGAGKEQGCGSVVAAALGAAQAGSSGGKSSQKGGEAQMPRNDTPKRGRPVHKSKSAHGSAAKAAASKSKSPHRSAVSRRSLSPKKGLKKSEHHHHTKNLVTLNGSPSNHVTSLLLTNMMKTYERGNKQVEDGQIISRSFLLVVDYLEIIADLVLAAPACAAAIHRYRPLIRVHHALLGCPPPPSTAVGFFLHELLPQERAALPKQPSSGQDHEANCMKDDRRKDAYMKIKISQTTARLLVALVARAGEGRRRVITDLSFALNGPGSCGPSHTDAVKDGSNDWRDFRDNENHEMWALQSWGEICLGLAAPRSTGAGGPDSDKSLSLEVVRLMLECGMAHALLHGVQRVRMHHPLAAQVASALIRPLEVFTRGSVTDSVIELAEKAEEEGKKASRGNDSAVEGKKVAKKSGSDTSLTRAVTIGPSQQSEAAFADDAMLDDGFDAETAEQTARRRTTRQQGLELSVGMGVDYEEEEEEEDEEEVEDMDEEDESSDDDSEMSESMEDEGSSVVDGNEDNSSDDDDEEDSSGSGSGSGSEEGVTSDSEAEEELAEGLHHGAGSADDESEESSEEPTEDSNILDSDDDAEHMEEDEIDDQFDQDVREEEEEDFFEGVNDDDDDEGGDDEDPEDDEEDADPDEPWTFLGHDVAHRGGLGRRTARHGGRSGGFMVEAAEAMIGNILRAGDLQMDALAELEDTLGIRIIHRGGSGGPDQFRYASSSSGSAGGGGSGGTRSVRGNDENLSSINRGPLGNTPVVHQGLPPDSGSRLGDSNPMEYLYGGPAMMAGSQSYDLSRHEPQEDDTFPVPPSVDTQLFPGGPAAAMHTRTQQRLHPLLCGVELPPFNAMISAAGCYGSRQGVRSHGSADPDWGGGGSTVVASYLSGGNVLRISRGPGGRLLESSRTANGGAGGSGGATGWTDDGQPLDGAAGEFGLAFERALSDTIARNLPSSDGASAEGTGSAGSVDDAAARQGRSSSGAEESAAASVPPDGGAATDANEGGDVPEPPTSHVADTNRTGAGDSVPSTRAELTSGAGNMDAAAGSNIEGNGSEGEGVASSLAAGLRLSPISENSTSSELTSTVQAVTEEDVTPTIAPTLRDQGASSGTGGQGSFVPGDAGGEAPMDTAEEEQQIDTSESVAIAGATDASAGVIDDAGNGPNANGLVCPPGMDLEVFNSLPFEMQREVVEQHQAAEGVAAQLDPTSGLDPEALAALPEEMRQEVIAQEQQERRLREEAPADPSNAEEMDNASFVASLAPDLREEILLSADDAFLNSLPPDMQGEAQILRERAASSIRRRHEEAAAAAAAAPAAVGGGTVRARSTGHSAGDGASNASGAAPSSSSRKRQRNGKMRVDCDRSGIVYMPSGIENESGPLMTGPSLKALVRLMYLLSPVRPQRLLHNLIQNFSANPDLRKSFIMVFVSLLNDDTKGALLGVRLLEKGDGVVSAGRKEESSDNGMDFPPLSLIGTAPDVAEIDLHSSNAGTFRRRHGISPAAAIAANLPASARGSSRDGFLPPVVARRIIDTGLFLTKSAPRTCLDLLGDDTMEIDGVEPSLFERLLDLLDKPLYSKSATNLEQLLTMLEGIVGPLSLLPKDGDRTAELSSREMDAAAESGKEYVDVPRPVVSPHRLKSLCSLLRLESCRDSSFVKVNTIARRLCRVEANRTCILRELASVAQGLGADAIRDLRSLGIRLNDAVQLHRVKLVAVEVATASQDDKQAATNDQGVLPASRLLSGTPSSAVTLSTSSSEIKLLRVLQTLHVLCGELHDESGKKHEGNHIYISQELVSLLQSIDLESLWDQLTSCLRLVSVLEGVSHADEIDEKKGEGEDQESDAGNDEDQDTNDEGSPGGNKKLQNSVVGLLTRFLPTIEAFFVVNASSVENKAAKEHLKSDAAEESKNDEGPSHADGVKPDEDKDADISMLVGGKRLVEFVGTNKVLLNALLRSNPSLLEKSLRAMVQVPRCRPFLDFDVKRQWFKTHVRRLRQHAGRRHGSLRLHIRRKHVFEDAFHRLQLRNADEMRGRLHITFRNEEGVDAGGLSREFFAILAKEMFNPNYALFTSTEDGCTFQPNPNSSINPDHLSYFRFVGRIVGKALVDGFLLDAHFTRSLYKHMLGVKPTHHDMEAIDPDYYRNLKTILEYNLNDLGLDLTFSTDEHSFGKSQTVDLIENGRNIKVTEQTKAKYVSLVCQHRMTTAIESQIKAYLDGFHELVKSDLISIFTPKELELLISGLPDIDIHDLKKNTDYQGYKATDKEIGWFWNIMFSLSRSEKAAFLQFVTGSSKVPLNGFSELQGMRGIQKFSIHRAGGSGGALMSAHTCFNALDLPVYKSEEETREKLIYAISEGGGAFMFA